MKSRVAMLSEVADRFDALAETAALMGDEDGAARFHEQAARCRAEAMKLLDP